MGATAETGMPGSRGKNPGKNRPCLKVPALPAQIPAGLPSSRQTTRLPRRTTVPRHCAQQLTPLRRQTGRKPGWGTPTYPAHLPGAHPAPTRRQTRTYPAATRHLRPQRPGPTRHLPGTQACTAPRARARHAPARTYPAPRHKRPSRNLPQAPGGLPGTRAAAAEKTPRGAPEARARWEI